MAINPFFNANYYLANNPDLVAAGLHTPEQLWEHYTTFGAQERADLLDYAIITPSLRKANDWFDVDYYLATNADLVAAGITAGQALNHYYEYGINEGRAFNPNPALQPSEFDAETYAEENPDVREHYGIEEGAELTAADKANLLEHYLAFGIYEGREGAGEEFSNAIQEISFDTTTVRAGTNEVGTLANDKFVVVDGVETKDWYIDGAGGKNEVVFNTTVGANANSNLTLRNIQSVEVDGKVEVPADGDNPATTVGIDVTATVNGLLDSLTLTNAGNVDLTFSGVNGTADALNVDVVAATGALTVNGLETVNLAFDEDFKADSFELNADKSQGADQVVNLTGGKGVTGELALTFENVSSPNLENLTIDGTALEAGLGAVELGDQIVNVNSITIKGSKAKGNDLSVVNTGLSEELDLVVTLVGGDKADTFTATAAIETFTGGRGDDTFNFIVATTKVKLDKDGEKIVGVDTITDFKKGDEVKVTDADFSALVIVEVATGKGSLSLEELLLTAGAVVDENEDATTLTQGMAFNFGGDAYLVVEGVAEGADELDSVSLIKLAGVDASKLKFEDDAIVLA